jgi:fructose-1,6-bisphosphatase
MSKVTKNSKRIWSNEELTFAYYVAKYGSLDMLKMTKEDVVHHIIGNTTERSFDMQVENFKHLLGIGEGAYDNYSQKMVEVSESLKNHTVTNVREILMDYAMKMDDVAEQRRVSRANKTVKSKTDELNEVLNKQFENKLKMMKLMGRNLTPINK